MDHVLTYMTFCPIAGMVVVLCLPGAAHALIRWTAAAFTVPPLLLATWLFVRFDRAVDSVFLADPAVADLWALHQKARFHPEGLSDSEWTSYREAANHWLSQPKAIRDNS